MEATLPVVGVDSGKKVVQIGDGLPLFACPILRVNGNRVRSFGRCASTNSQAPCSHKTGNGATRVVAVAWCVLAVI
jgi:hypothetical protein